MGALGNTPRRTTVLSLEARKSFAFRLLFQKADGETPINLTDATVRFVMAQPVHLGGAVLVSKTATVLDAVLGQVQFELQAADLDQTEAEYPFDVTLVSANGYSTPVMKGVVDLRANTDLDDTNVFTGVNPATQLGVLIEDGGEVTVQVESLDGMYLLVLQRITEVNTARDQTQAAADGVAADRIAADEAANAALLAASGADESETNAAASAAAAESSAVTASTKAAAASTSATNASASETAAAGSASAAATSETNAAASASAAATSETNAAASASDAAASAAQAEQIVTGDLDTNVAAKVNDPASATNNAIETLIGGTAPAAHAHDDRYYTETEIDTMLGSVSGGAVVQAEEPVLGEGEFWYDTDDDLPAGLDGTGFRMTRSGKDANGLFTTIEYFRHDNTLALRSVLSGGASPSYTTRTVTEYAGDGTTVLLTTTYTLTYDGDGDLTSEAFA